MTKRTYDITCLHLSGRTEAQIAEQLRISIPAVSQHISKAAQSTIGLRDALAVIRNYHAKHRRR